MPKKLRLSVSVDADLVEAAETAVAHGQADSISAWVSDALSSKLERDRRLRGLAAFIADYEAEHGEITAEERKQVIRDTRARAIKVRSTRPKIDEPLLPGLAE